MISRTYNRDRWGALHNYTVVGHGKRAYLVINHTAGERSPMTFPSRDAAFAWLIRTACAGEAPFEDVPLKLDIIDRQGGWISTSRYGGVRFKNRLRATAKGARELKNLQILGLVKPYQARGGEKRWQLTTHAIRLLGLIGIYRENKWQDTCSSSKM